MAKFNRRRTPPKVTFPYTLQYGYRGGYFVVNGLRYNSSTGAVVTNSEQDNAAFDISYRDDSIGYVAGITLDLPSGGDTIAPLAVDSCFEPSMIASVYDLLGSKFTSEHEEGTYVTYGTYRNSSGHCFFKNRVLYPSSSYSLDSDARVTSGSVNGANTQFAIVSGLSSYPLAYGYTYVPDGHYIPVEKPSGTYNTFSPYTFATLQGHSAGSLSNQTKQFVVAEKVFGNTTVNFTNTMTNNLTIQNSQWAAWWVMAGAHKTSDGNLTKSGLLDNYVSVEVSDAHMYGANIASYNVVSLLNEHQNIFGGYLYTNKSNSYVNVGAPESGVRIFLSRSSSYSFYLLYDSWQGGHQGVDKGTDDTARLTLRTLNHGTGSTTILGSFKKGVAGLIIPSQPDEDTSTNYRFYMVSPDGADSATQTISIRRPKLDLTNGTMALGNTYVNSMTTEQQEQFYADMGHNNTQASQYNHAQFRRSNVYRVWYSTSATAVKRLHLGVYNTNSTGFVTSANGFDASGSRGAMFKIYSWTLDDSAETATYIGSIDMHTYAPRYFCPLDVDWRDIYVGSSIGNDVIISLNNSTGLYQFTTSLPYNAARLFKDRDGRWCTQVVDLDVPVVSNIYGSYIDVIAADVASTVSITAPDTTFTYSGNVINSSIIVNVFDYQGNRVAKNITLNIIGETSTPGVTFDNGSYVTTLTTSSSANTVANVRIVSAASAKIVGTVLES
jgi:hypothetical protein